MKFSEHLSKLSWTAFDKMIFIIYGGVTLMQISRLAPEEWGLASQLITLQTWIFIVCDGSALQSIIQFGVKEEDRGRVNFITLIFLLCISMGLSGLIMLLQQPLSEVFHEPRFADVASTLPAFVLLTLPRAFGLKLMMRELRMRDVFFVDLAWFGSMAAMTVWMLRQGSFHDYADMKLISLWGMGCSSLVAIMLSFDMLEFRRQGSIRLAQILAFGLPQALMMALNNSIRQLDVFLIQPFFGTATAGVYNSAKMLYRIFETVTDAGIALMYPTAVKLLAADKRDQIIIVFSKAISLLVMMTVLSVAVLWAGGTTLIVGFLGPKYVAAAAQFNTMLVAALFLPLFILQSVDLAFHKVWKLLGIVSASAVVGVGTFLITGSMHSERFISLGIITYSLSFALLLIISVRADLHFPISKLFRTIPDAIEAVQGFRARVSGTAAGNEQLPNNG